MHPKKEKRALLCNSARFLAALGEESVSGLGVSVAREEPESEDKLREQFAATLRDEVAAMNIDNFVVRPRRRLVERFAKPEAWKKLQPNDFAELRDEIAGLPSELDPEGEEAKRFDSLILSTQLAVLRAEPQFRRLRDQVRTIAGLLEENSRIPAIQQRLVLIQEIQTEEWWEHVTVGMLETARMALRELVKLIEKKRRKPVYSDFGDQRAQKSSLICQAWAAHKRLRTQEARAGVLGCSSERWSGWTDKRLKRHSPSF